MSATPTAEKTPDSAHGNAPQSTHSDPQRPGAWNALGHALADIKLAHSVFALPFAILAAVAARPVDGAWSRFAGQLVVVVVCMVLARTWAMMINRLVDRAFDARNARTARRALAAGRISPSQGWAIALVCAAMFVGAAAMFWVFFDNRWPVMLSAPVLAWIAFYSFTKRFTWLCHVFLGGALAASPLAAAIAVDPSSLSRLPVLWYLAGMVVLWVAGFDVIYAIQDLEFDQREGLSSIPARLGLRGAMWTSRVLHSGAFAMLLQAWRAEPRFGPIFGAAVGLVAALLVMEHVVLARRGNAGLDMAFFTLNGIVSCALGAAGCVDLLV
ncbi:MAG: 4-hydroxybenzoate octaprenyltransferase [Phycisphaerales bacterium]|nr:4-hydroxybenzoate octaprenyltransferase [Phycisphaerales bacterium]